MATSNDDLERVRERLNASRAREAEAARMVEEEREKSREAGRRFALEEAEMEHVRKLRDFVKHRGSVASSPPHGSERYFTACHAVSQIASRYGVKFAHSEAFAAGALEILDAAEQPI